MNIYSIFQSVNGEVCSAGMGSMCTFIRFAGCSAGCPYCDTTYAVNPLSGKPMYSLEVLNAVELVGCKNVTITGGEPFEQRSDLQELIYMLSSRGYLISVETNGLHEFDVEQEGWFRANWVVDIKKHTPVDFDRILKMNLRCSDFIKIVVASKEEFDKAVLVKTHLQLEGCKATFAFSPEYTKVAPNVLLSWMRQEHQNDSVLNVQMHKVLLLSEAD